MGAATYDLRGHADFDGGSVRLDNVYTGDVITILQPKDEFGGECLRFVCTFFYGDAKLQRQAPFEVLVNKKPTRYGGQTAAATPATARLYV